MKPMFPTYVMQNLQGHLSVVQDFIFSLLLLLLLLLTNIYTGRIPQS